MSHRVWLGSVMGVVALQSLIFASCSTSLPIELPAKVDSIKSQSKDGLGSQFVASGEVQLNLSSTELPDPVGRLLLSAKQTAFFENSTSLSFFGAGSSGLLSLDKKYDILPVPAPLPSFAAGKTFLPVSEGGSDFWLVNSEAGGVNVVRPLKPLTAGAESILPEHMLASIKADATAIGYSEEFLLLASSDSLWIVQKDSSKLTVNEVGSPEAGAVFISAGSISGGSSSFWFATPEKIWILQSQGSDWSAREFTIKLSGISGKLSKLNTAFELSGERLKVKGPIIAQVGDKMGSAGVKLSVGGGGPQPDGTTSPSGQALSFAEAQALCNECHATTSGNNAAKAKLVGTENINTWIASKINIADEVVNNRMPPGGMDPALKTKFLNFVNNPVQ